MKTSIEGRNVVLEALKSGRKVFEIKIDGGAKGKKVDDIYASAAAVGVRVVRVPRTSLDKITKTGSHQGVIAIAEERHPVKLGEVLKASGSLFFVVLKDVSYEHNLGAVLRTASAAGASAVVIPPSRGNPLTPIVERVSMGASNKTPLVAEGVHSVLSELKRRGVKIVGVEVSGKSDYFDVDLTGDIALVFGGEDEGLSLPMVQKCDIVVRIPMSSGMQSLNQSVAAALIMYEKVRQEKYAK